MIEQRGIADAEITERSGRLTNLDIATNHRDGTRWLMKSDFLGAFAYWVVKQSPYDATDITPALKAFDGYLSAVFDNSEMPIEFTYAQLGELITEDIFEAIPEIEKLAHRKNGRDGIAFADRFTTPIPDDDFICLGALARNVFYMVMRESITQS